MLTVSLVFHQDCDCDSNPLAQSLSLSLTFGLDLAFRAPASRTQKKHERYRARRVFSASRSASTRWIEKPVIWHVKFVPRAPPLLRRHCHLTSPLHIIAALGTDKGLSRPFGSSNLW